MMKRGPASHSSGATESMEFLSLALYVNGRTVGGLSRRAELQRSDPCPSVMFCIFYGAAPGLSR